MPQSLRSAPPAKSVFLALAIRVRFTSNRSLEHKSIQWQKRDKPDHGLVCPQALDTTQFVDGITAFFPRLGLAVNGGRPTRSPPRHKKREENLAFFCSLISRDGSATAGKASWAIGR